MLGRGNGIPFMVIAVVSYYVHAHFPWLFLVLLPWLGLLVTRFLASLHFEDPCWWQDVCCDVKRMGIWLVLSSMALGSIPIWSPNSLFLQHGDVLVWKEWFTLHGSPFKAVGMLLMTGTMLLEASAPRTLVLSYWVRHVKLTVPVALFLETWKDANKSLYLSGLGYLMIVYTLCALSPLFAYGAWLCLIDFYKRCIYDSHYQQA